MGVELNGKFMTSKLRRLGSETAIYGVSTVLGRFLTFFLTPLYTHVIEPAELGEVANLFALIAFANIFYSFGLESAFFRFFARDDRVRSDRVFSLSFISLAAISGLLTLLIVFAADFLRGPAQIDLGADMVRAAGLIALFDALVLIPFALLRMEGRAKRFALTKFAVIVLNVVANVVFLFVFQWGVAGIFYAGLLSSAAGLVMTADILWRRLRPYFDVELLREMFRFGLPTIPASFAAIVLQLIDRPLLKALAGADAVGIYQANYRLAIPMMMFVTVFDYAWKPFFLREAAGPEQEAKKLFSRVMTWFVVGAMVIFLVVAFFMEYIVTMPVGGLTLIDASYWGGLFIIPIVLGGYFFHGISTNLLVGPYIAKKTSLLAWSTLSAACVNVLVNILLIPSMGIAGAAWATFAAYFVGAGVLYFASRSLYAVQYEWSRILIIVVLALADWAAVEILTQDWTLLPAMLCRLGGLLLFVIVLYFGGLLNTAELTSLRRLFRR